MRKSPIAVVLYVALSAAHACSPAPGFSRTLEARFADAPPVVHVRVDRVGSQAPHGLITYPVTVIRRYKGDLPVETVVVDTMSSCGIGSLEVGQDCVFFMGESRMPWLSGQPDGWRDTPVRLDALRKLGR